MNAYTLRHRNPDGAMIIGCTRTSTPAKMSALFWAIQEVCHITGKLSVEQCAGVCISTPMLNRNNDCMNIYIGDDPNGGYVITDLGETICDLEPSGFAMTSKREAKLSAILAGYPVESRDGELCVRTSQDDLPLKMNMLLQAMASVDDMFLLSQDNVRDLFTEDVREWLKSIIQVVFVGYPHF